MEKLGNSIDDFHCLVSKFDLDFERIYHLQYDDIGELLPAIDSLYNRYRSIDNKFNEIVDMAKKINIDGDGDYGDYLDEVTTEYIRITDIKETLNKVIKVV